MHRTCYHSSRHLFIFKRGRCSHPPFTYRWRVLPYAPGITPVDCISMCISGFLPFVLVCTWSFFRPNKTDSKTHLQKRVTGSAVRPRGAPRPPRAYPARRPAPGSPILGRSRFFGSCHIGPTAGTTGCGQFEQLPCSTLGADVPARDAGAAASGAPGCRVVDGGCHTDSSTENNMARRPRRKGTGHLGRATLPPATCNAGQCPACGSRDCGGCAAVLCAASVCGAVLCAACACGVCVARGAVMCAAPVCGAVLCPTCACGVRPPCGFSSAPRAACELRCCALCLVPPVPPAPLYLSALSILPAPAWLGFGWGGFAAPRIPRGWGTTCLCSFPTSAPQKWKFPKPIFLLL